MPKRSSKREDFAETAFRVVATATGTLPPPPRQPAESGPTKNAAAVELGRKGGLARAANLDPHERRTAAKKAALARWHSGKR